MKIIAINGSPKKERNTAFLLQTVLLTAENLGAETDLLHLVDYNIKFCSGCNRCLKAGICSIQDDDMTALSESLLNADGIVFGSPSYFMNVSALMKNFIDRSRPLHVYTNKLKGKIGGALTVAGLRHGGQESVVDYLERYLRSQGMILADCQEKPNKEARVLFTGGPIGAIYKDIDGENILWRKAVSEDSAAIQGAVFLAQNMVYLIKKLGQLYY